MIVIGGVVAKAADQQPRFETREADQEHEQFNWCPVAPIFCHALLAKNRAGEHKNR